MKRSVIPSVILFLTLATVFATQYFSFTRPFYADYLRLKNLSLDQTPHVRPVFRLLDSIYLQFFSDHSGTLFFGYLFLGFLIVLTIFHAERTANESMSASLTSTGETRPHPHTFRQFLFPNGFFSNSNVRIDLILFATKRFWTGFALSVPFLSSHAMAITTIGLLDSYSPSPRLPAGPILCLVFSLFALLITDLIFYLTHYWQHFTKLGWSLHQTHHSQTELNIFTDDRETPLNFILISLFPSGVLGALVGVFLYLFPDAHDILVADLSIGLLLWMPTKIFRHSHILIRFPKWIEYLIQSPAFHIVHHSDLPQHRNKNLGNWTTVWDRIFGTLYVPQPKESYRFGIGDELLERSHKSLIGIYFWQTGRVLKQLCSPFLPNPKP